MSKKSTFMQSMIAVLWAFLGVRKKSGLHKSTFFTHETDFDLGVVEPAGC